MEQPRRISFHLILRWVGSSMANSGSITQRSFAKTAAALVPSRAALPVLREIAAACRACDLWKKATQTVFGEGPARAKLLFVGEQPGDGEDRAGQPFVGPAGQLLDRALAAAGIDRAQVYVTNTVKHFKWESRGKRRIHKKPRASEIEACKPWLEAEISAVKPELVICLGATAAQALLGRNFRVTRERGVILKSDLAPRIMATVHPSSLLRAPDEQERQRQMGLFVEDLRRAAGLLRKPAA
jgi:uracil-DNA glycosylase family protein